MTSKCAASVEPFASRAYDDDLSFSFKHFGVKSENLPLTEICMSCWAFRLGDRPTFNTLLKVFEKLPRKRLARSPSYPSSHVSRSAESLF
uniref:Serine-threonine/tyrosine-protein kinase catalytic domain-containing protein n=1 Tax=Trichuris muris TaxID=70415 RepID=A0A5S6Q3H2_TRIMR